MDPMGMKATNRKAVEIFRTPRHQGPPNRRLAVQSWDESPQTSHLSGQWIAFLVENKTKKTQQTQGFDYQIQGGFLSIFPFNQFGLENGKTTPGGQGTRLGSGWVAGSIPDTFGPPCCIYPDIYSYILSDMMGVNQYV